MQRTDSDPITNPAAKKVSRLRYLVGFLLLSAAVAVGVGSYMGVFYFERANAVARFNHRYNRYIESCTSHLNTIDINNMYTIDIRWVLYTMHRVESAISRLDDNLKKMDDVMVSAGGT
jgi:hypothetical protein